MKGKKEYLEICVLRVTLKAIVREIALEEVHRQQEEFAIPHIPHFCGITYQALAADVSSLILYHSQLHGSKYASLKPLSALDAGLA